MITFTLESDAAQGEAWREGIGELIELAGRCSEIHIARTTGARRESSEGKDREAADRRLELFEQLPEITETGVQGISRYGEAHYGDADDQERYDQIRAALRPAARSKPDRSEANDILHLATHLKYRRHYFVTSDQIVHRARERLKALGIAVVDPAQALQLARGTCP